MTRSANPLTLPAALYGFVGLGACLFVLVASTLFMNQMADFRNEALEEAVHVRTQGAALAYARALSHNWEHLKEIAGHVQGTDRATLNVVLSTTAHGGEGISWAGYADVGGQVVAASDGFLEGQDVSSRPWFQRGLQKPFAGDVHDAVLLNTLLGGTEADPIRFLDLAAPVLGSDGQALGVLGFHINTDWAEAFLSETARSLDLDLYLIDASGQVVLSSDGTARGPLELQIVRAAAAGAQVSSFETWPDGADHFTTIVPQIAYGDLPSFGWRLVGRIDSSAFLSSNQGLQQTVVGTLALMGGLLLILSVAFARIFLRPIRDLANNATRMARGHDDYPLEFTHTSELAALSSALAELQGLSDDRGRISAPQGRTGDVQRPLTGSTA